MMLSLFIMGLKWTLNEKDELRVGWLISRTFHVLCGSSQPPLRSQSTKVRLRVWFGSQTSRRTFENFGFKHKDRVYRRPEKNIYIQTKAQTDSSSTVKRTRELFQPPSAPTTVSGSSFMAALNVQRRLFQFQI